MKDEKDGGRVTIDLIETELIVTAMMFSPGESVWESSDGLTWKSGWARRWSSKDRISHSAAAWLWDGIEEMGKKRWKCISE